MGMAERNLSSELRTIDKSEPQYIFDERTSRFWLKDADGHWIWMAESSLKRHLKGIGLRAKADESELLSPVETVVSDAEFRHRVAYAGPLAGRWSGFRNIVGQQCLITEDPDLIEPREPPEDAGRLDEDAYGACVGWPVLGRVVRNMLSGATEENGIDQRAYYFGYVRHVLDCLYNDDWQKVIALGVGGEVKSGKSLLFVDVHRELFGRKEGKPYSWMLGRDNFNDNLLHAVLLTIDDEMSQTNMEARNNLGDQVKKMVANSSQNIRGMHKSGFATQPLWALTILVNMEPGNLMVLPPLEKDTRDKILLLKAYKAEMPMPVATPDDRRIFWQRIKSELPYFVWWIRNEWETPEELKDRFGVRHWHHPEILKSLHELSPEHQIWIYLERTLFKDSYVKRHPETGEELEHKVWVGTADELHEYLTNTQTEERPTLSQYEARGVPKGTWLGQRLRKLQEVYPRNVEAVRTAKARYWRLTSPDSAIFDTK